MKSFRIWLRQFRTEQNPTGNLTRSIMNDPEFPTKNDVYVILEYMEMKAYPIHLFKWLWREYMNTLTSKDIQRCTSCLTIMIQ